MSATKIEWSEVTWNPTTGCDRVSAGCDHCYALTLARRLKAMGSAKYQRDGDPRTSGPGFGITEHPDVLELPLRWRKPRRIFVNSTSDLFHKGVSDEFIARVFAVMAVTPQHTFQVLTKRHGRMRALLSSETFRHEVALYVRHRDELYSRELVGWPLPNVWCGVSVEDQRWADVRIPALLDTPAAVRFISAEPLLGPVDLGTLDTRDGVIDALVGNGDHVRRDGGELTSWVNPRPLPRLDWVIVGGESGPGARRMDLGWARQIVELCWAADVPVFVKQLGSTHGLRKGGDMDTWPEDLRVREFPAVAGPADPHGHERGLSPRWPLRRGVS